MPAVEVEVAAVKDNVARGSVCDVMRPTREAVRAMGKMVPSAEMTEVIWTREVRASNAGRGEMLCSYTRGSTGRSAPHVRSAKVVSAEVSPTEVACTEMTASADMRGASEVTTSANMRVTTDVTSKVATATMEVAATGAAMSSVVLRHGRRCSDQGECGNSAKSEFSYVTHGSPPQSPPTCI